MSTTLHSSMSPQVATLLRQISQTLGADINLQRSPSFKLSIESLNGQDVNFKYHPLDQGPSGRQNNIRSSAFAVPSGGPADLDGIYGTTTLIGSTKTVTPTAPAEGGVAVPVGSLVFATATTPAGVSKKLTAVRASDTTITISSAGDGYGELLESAGVAGTLVAGEKADIALANAAGDRLSVVETAAGGSAADHFSIVRVSDSLVKVQAHDAAGALVAGNTSTVKVYNFGQKGHDTSLVRWCVVRP